MTEAELQDTIVELANWAGYRVAHFRPARQGDRYVTPVQYQAAGFPDLIIAKRGLTFAVEVKSEKGRLATSQGQWLDALQGNTIDTHVWRPSDWISGDIETVLLGGPR